MQNFHEHLKIGQPAESVANLNPPAVSVGFLPVLVSTFIPDLGR